MINFSKLFSKEYLISIDIARLHPTDHGLFFLGAGLTALGVVCFLASRFAGNPFSRRFRQRLGTWALTIGLLEVLWFGLRYQNAQILGSHLVGFIVLLVGVVWLFY